MNKFAKSAAFVLGLMFGYGVGELLLKVEFITAFFRNPAVAGATMDGKRQKKADVIFYALANCGITDLARVVMIGDREHDVLGARQAGVDSIGVLYGYGDRQELEADGATCIADTVAGILPLLLS